jgi:hypothetical protein
MPFVDAVLGDTADLCAAIRAAPFNRALARRLAAAERVSAIT